MTKTKDSAIMPVERIAHSILILRGHRVIIDRDLAAIYGVSTRTASAVVPVPTLPGFIVPLYRSLMMFCSFGLRGENAPCGRSELE